MEPEVNKGKGSQPEVPGEKQAVEGTGPAVYVYEGVLAGWFETGTEGVVWTLDEDGISGYEAMVILEEGDVLTVRSKSGEILFDGMINPDYDAGAMARPSGMMQPVALGMWVHWTQSGWNPDDWARLFMEDENRGRLVKGPDAEFAPVRPVK